MPSSEAAAAPRPHNRPRRRTPQCRNRPDRVHPLHDTSTWILRPMVIV